ncbi:MAG: preprotein translocase subunit SecG [Clostridia bacterium]|nr:preprotein translocase subunit SecG [Clostridia bacterium]
MNKFSNFVNLIAEGDTAVAGWIASSFPVIKIVLASLIFVCALLMIIMVLSQRTESDGSMNAITGQADTFYNRNKGGNLQGKIKRFTVILAILLMVFCITFFVLNAIYQG